MEEANTTKEFQNIVDCITATDGGLSFIKLKIMIETLEEQYQEGDYQAGQILDIVTRFSRLIDVANEAIQHKNEE